MRRYPHLRISVRGPGPSGTSTHLTRQLPGTRYGPRRPVRERRSNRHRSSGNGDGGTSAYAGRPGLSGFQLGRCEVTPVMEMLSCKGVPMIIYTGRGLPPDLASQHPHVTVLRKPVCHTRLVAELAAATGATATAA